MKEARFVQLFWKIITLICCLRKFGHSVSSLALHVHVAALLGFYFQFFSEWINLVLVWHCQKHIFVVNGNHCSHRYRKKALHEIVSLKKGLQCFPLTSLPAALCMQTDSVPEKPQGGTLGISGWGCAAGTLEPLTYARASSAEFCYPVLE